jgi:hypothetical protein
VQRNLADRSGRYYNNLHQVISLSYNVISTLRRSGRFLD